MCMVAVLVFIACELAQGLSCVRERGRWLERAVGLQVAAGLFAAGVAAFWLLERIAFFIVGVLNAYL